MATPHPGLADAPLLRAARGLPAERVPVWFMRQAGRSLPEYRALRGEGSILDAIHDPALSAEITLQPVRRYGVDAAILYSDIVVPAAAIGFGVDVTPGVGPVVAEPFRTRADLDRLRPFEPELDAPYVAETVRLVVADLGA
ncbi:MAG: uroporphyrinogen decarboxylase family protein, partial [Acidimicrobiales bacterium]